MGEINRLATTSSLLASDDDGKAKAERFEVGAQLKDQGRANAVAHPEFQVVAEAHRPADVPVVDLPPMLRKLADAQQERAIVEVKPNADAQTMFPRPADSQQERAILEVEPIADAQTMLPRPADSQQELASVEANPHVSKVAQMLQVFDAMQTGRSKRKRDQLAADDHASAKPSAGKQKKAKAHASKAKASKRPMGKSSAKAIADTPAAEPETQVKKGCGQARVDHEASRNQYLARSGSSGQNSSRSFKYSPTSPGSKTIAEKKAKEWVKQFLK